MHNQPLTGVRNKPQRQNNTHVNSMKTPKLLVIGLALALPLVAKATIIGSKHDFSTNSWNSRHGVCSPCHSIHDTDPNQLIPLWSHATTTKTFNVYDSPTFQGHASITQPGGASKACLSCHDGSLAVNQSASGSITGGATNAQFVGASRLIAEDGDLHSTHPVSFSYSDSEADPFIFPASTPLQWTPGAGLTGKKISDILIAGKLECATCHDIHRQKGDAPTDTFMRIISSSAVDANGRGSLLCRTCHNK